MRHDLALLVLAPPVRINARGADRETFAGLHSDRPSMEQSMLELHQIEQVCRTAALCSNDW